MGWLYTSGSTLKSQIAARSESWENDKAKSVCLAKVFRGNVLRQGVLWSVWEQTIKETGEVRRIIQCDLLEYSRESQGWGYKDMDEMMHPYYYHCPLKYLKMVPEDKYPAFVCKAWREKVKEYHKQKKAKKKQAA